MNTVKSNQIDFAALARNMAERESGKILTPSHWIDQVAERLQEMRSGQRPGDLLPWSRTHDHIQLRPGELSIHAGMSGHRNSMLLGWIMANLAKKKPVAIASLEMRPEETILRMARQCIGSANPSTNAIGDFIGWADQERFWLYDELDKVAWQRVLGFVYHCAVNLQVEHIVIDSLTKCGINPGDGESEKEFIDRLQWAAKTFGAHIHLVCHVRKPQHAGEEYIPGKFDVRGASEMTDLADNVFIYWADKKRERLKDKAERFTLDLKESEYLKTSCDQKLIVVKQRHGSWEGAVNLYLDQKSLQFVCDEGRRIDFDFNTTLEIAA